MISENALIEFPYASNGEQRLEGRSAMRKHLEQMAEICEIDKSEEKNVFGYDALRTTVIEFNVSGKWRSSGVRFNGNNVAIIETENGYIVRYREYWNPLLATPPAG